jgi:POLQ-like helicase
MKTQPGGGEDKMTTSRARAGTWPYPRHARFEKALRAAAATWFRAHEFPVNDRTPYILATWKDWTKNIILPEVAQHIRDEREAHKSQGKPFPLHRFIHHGLSSQAMMFNLMGPLVLRDDLVAVASVLAKSSVPWPKGVVTTSFEYHDREVFKEHAGQPTSVDLVIKSNDIPYLFVEGKLVETGFGGCSVFERGDCDGRNPAKDFSLCYLHHLGRTYWELLKKHGFLSGPVLQDTACILSNQYQFFREVLFALHMGGYFVLVTDERNPTFHAGEPDGERGLAPLLLAMVPPSLRHRVADVSIQQLVSAIKASRRHEWIQQFQQKYGLMGDSP